MAGGPLELVFGPNVDPQAWEAADEDERRQMVAGRFEISDTGHLLLRHLLIEQMVSGEPPEVWATAQRLAGQEIDHDAVLAQLTIALGRTVTDALDDRSFDRDAYARRLRRLPLPTAPEIEQVLLDAAAEAVVVSSEALDARVVERLGHADKELVETLIDHVEQHLIEDFGPLAWLPGDRTAHVPSLCRDIVLTHTVTEAERTSGTLDISFDLAGFAHVVEPNLDGTPLDVVADAPGRLAWEGPGGWLDRYEPGAIAVRVDPDGAVTLERLDAEPATDPALVTAVRRAYDEAVDEPQLPVSGHDLVLGVLAHDRAAFARPTASLTALCAAAGLEIRGGDVAHDPSIWTNGRRVVQIHRIIHEADGDDELADAALAVLDTCNTIQDGAAIDDDAVAEALDTLCDLDVLALVLDEIVDPRHVDASTGRLVEGLLAAAGRPHLRAVARLVAALHAEATGDWAAAEKHLELAVEADPAFVPTTDRLAWYASDRGDAARASRLWRRCPASPAIGQDLDAIEPFARSAATPRRNDPCWCGSGRKYKQCHIGAAPPAELPDRVRWLCRKATGYLERIGPEAREAVTDIALARVGEDGDLAHALADSLVLDLTLTEGGWFERFLADRGHLLPDDEALLAASWLTVERSVHEVVSAEPGVGLTVRDLRAGDEIDVRERTFSRAARPGTLVCARAVPDGVGHQLVGTVLPVAPGTESALLDLLDQGDPHEIAAWVRAVERPPELRTREGERLVEREIVVTADDTEALIRHLDATYDVDVRGEWWTEHHDLDEREAIIRARFHLDGDRLTITTNSDERANRILGRFGAGPGVRVVSDRRTPIDARSVAGTERHGLPDLGGVPGVRPPRSADPAGVPSAPELDDAAIAELQEQMETKWCTEPVPALGGVTPEQAAADPTRREQLERLLVSFDDLAVPPGAFTMRTDRLRERLGL